MKRNASSTGDSLDLLLDTICNTFGGIVFISMLVVILVNAASSEISNDAPSEVDHRRLVEGRQQLSQMTIELASLRRTVRNLQEQRERFTDSASDELIRDLMTRQRTAAEEQDKRDESLGHLAEKQEVINDLTRKTEQLREAMKEARKELAEATQELESEIRLRSRTSRLPRQKTTTRQQASFFLRDGRLCAFARLDSGGRLVPNTTETRVRENNGKRYAEPVPGAGLLVIPDGSNLDAVAGVLEPFSSSQFFIAIVVWGDSFGHFPIVKEAIVRGDYEYQLIPLERDGKIYVGEAREQKTVQ